VGAIIQRPGAPPPLQIWLVILLTAPARGKAECPSYRGQRVARTPRKGRAMKIFIAVAAVLSLGAMASILTDDGTARLTDSVFLAEANGPSPGARDTAIYAESNGPSWGGHDTAQLAEASGPTSGGRDTALFAEASGSSPGTRDTALFAESSGSSPGGHDTALFAEANGPSPGGHDAATA
jgi:hypothetical protein